MNWNFILEFDTMEQDAASDGKDYNENRHFYGRWLDGACPECTKGGDMNGGHEHELVEPELIVVKRRCSCPQCGRSRRCILFKKDEIIYEKRIYRVWRCSEGHEIVQRADRRWAKPYFSV